MLAPGNSMLQWIVAPIQYLIFHDHISGVFRHGNHENQHLPLCSFVVVELK